LLNLLSCVYLLVGGGFLLKFYFSKYFKYWYWDRESAKLR